jgi:hypothetical protein
MCKYLSDIKTMVPVLMVRGRWFNNEGNGIAWSILEEGGLIPYKFFKGHGEILYSVEGDPGEHNSALYSMNV